MKKSEVENLKDWIKKNLPTKEEVKKIVVEIVEEKIDELAQSTNNGFKWMMKHMVSKEEAKQFATKEDLKQFATKSELQQMEKRMDEKFASKQDLIDFEDRMDTKFDQFADRIVKKDIVANRTTDDHEERITTLERRAGITV